MPRDDYTHEETAAGLPVNPGPTPDSGDDDNSLKRGLKRKLRRNVKRVSKRKTR
jgi:hypothetical protein